MPVPADPWFTLILTVCPGCMLVGFICVFAPFTKFKVKKLLFDISNEAVLDAIESADTFPRNEPVITVGFVITVT